LEEKAEGILPPLEKKWSFHYHQKRGKEKRIIEVLTFIYQQEITFSTLRGKKRNSKRREFFTS